MQNPGRVWVAARLLGVKPRIGALRRLLCALFCAILALVTVACQRGTDADPDPVVDAPSDSIRLVHLIVDGEMTGVEGRPLDPLDVEDWLWSALSSADHWRTDGSGLAASGRITWYLVDDPGHAAEIIVIWTAFLDSGTEDFPAPIELEAATLLSREEFYADPTAAMTEAVGQVVQMIDDAALVYIGTDEDVLEVARGSEPAVVPMAFHELQRRDVAEGLEVALAALDPHEPHVFIAAAGTVANFGDRSHVRALIDPLDTAEDVDVLLSVLPAIARLGGPDAVGFLQTLANGHADARVRQLATTLLDG